MDQDQDQHRNRARNPYPGAANWRLILYNDSCARQRQYRPLSTWSHCASGRRADFQLGPDGGVQMESQRRQLELDGRFDYHYYCYCCYYFDNTQASHLNGWRDGPRLLEFQMDIGAAIRSAAKCATSFKVIQCLLVAQVSIGNLLAFRSAKEAVVGEHALRATRSPLVNFLSSEQSNRSVVVLDASSAPLVVSGTIKWIVNLITRIINQLAVRPANRGAGRL